MQRAYAYCEGITKQYSKSFYLTSALLPPEKRRAARALYAFCRLSDNIVDDERPGKQSSAEARAQHLEAWRRKMRRPAEEQNHPALLAWADTRERYNIPLRYSEELLDGMLMDLQKCRYETFEDLWQYCYLAASTVGINSMYIIGFEDCDETFQRAEQLGVALQMTNILRDVGEDWERGRIYLPREDLDRFDYREDDLAQGVIDERYIDLMTFQIERTHALYDEAWPGIGLLHQDGRFAIGASAEVYRGILGKIERLKYDNHRVRAFVPKGEKFAMLPRIWWRVRQLED